MIPHQTLRTMVRRGTLHVYNYTFILKKKVIIIGHNKSMLPGTNSLSSPTSSEAGTHNLIHLDIERERLICNDR